MQCCEYSCFRVYDEKGKERDRLRSNDLKGLKDWYFDSGDTFHKFCPSYRCKFQVDNADYYGIQRLFNEDDTT